MARYKNPLVSRFEREFFSKIPKCPGVYFMRSARGDVLYIGKAKCLRDRLRSYRNARPDTVGRNIIQLLERVRKIEWEQHDSEEIAFQRELELIRAFVPRYNIADAWEEAYFFIGIRGPVQGKIEFRLTRFERDAKEFELHGCYPRRIQVKTGYSALLRVLFACANERERFSFPAKLTRPSPCYNYALKISEAEKWKGLISEFLHGKTTALLNAMVDRLLVNVSIPEYVRPGLQRDLYALMAFERNCLVTARAAISQTKAERSARTAGTVGTLSHQDLRERLQASLKISVAT